MTSETHISPDGTLRFLVVRTPDGDITMGFDGYAWHTHGDVLVSLSENPEAATQQFVDNLLANKSIIAVSTVGGKIRDVWVTDDPAEERKWCEADETIEFRLWDGTKIEA